MIPQPPTPDMFGNAYKMPCPRGHEADKMQHPKAPTATKHLRLC